MENRTLDLCGPRLRPCEGCGGMADYARAGNWAGWIVAKCTNCARQTGPHATSVKAAQDWNRRISDAARVVTLSELWDMDFDMGDDQTDVAVWIEGRCGTLRCAVLSFGINMGDPVVREYGRDKSFTWSQRDIKAEGQLYRIWDKKPTKPEREALDWGRPLWKDVREIVAEAKVKEALGNG